MAEIEREAKSVIVEYTCDFCPDGKMVRKGNLCFTSDPPKYEHQCTHCRSMQFFNLTYPYSKVVSV